MTRKENDISLYLMHVFVYSGVALLIAIYLHGAIEPVPPQIPTLSLIITTHECGVVMFSVASVCVSVCLSLKL